MRLDQPNHRAGGQPVDARRRYAPCSARGNTTGLSDGLLVYLHDAEGQLALLRYLGDLPTPGWPPSPKNSIPTTCLLTSTLPTNGSPVRRAGRPISRTAHSTP